MIHLGTGGKSLSQKLIKLIEKHDNIAFAVAWASHKTEAYEALIKNKGKIHRAVIGTHFYQTHPDVLKDFIDCNEVQFVLQPQGIFHPKAYLFWSKKSWDMLVGSANLTNGALGKNSELMLHISGDTPSDAQMDLRRQIEKYWRSQGEIVTAESESTYRKLWRIQQSALKRVSGSYASNAKSKAPVHTNIMSMSWPSFFQKVQDEPYDSRSKRCDLLDRGREAFEQRTSFRQMDLKLRKMIAGLPIAGLPSDPNSHWYWFGSMKGAGYFFQAVKENNLHISDALNLIPSNGRVGREHYDSYIEEFVRAFPKDKDEQRVGVASRLLAMKRPDCFVCLTSKNKERLCEDFGIKRTAMTYKRYWDDIVCRIGDSVWWNEPKPSDQKAIRVWLGRAAMLDAIFYQGGEGIHYEVKYNNRTNM